MSIYELPKFDISQKETEKKGSGLESPEIGTIEEGVPTVDINQQFYPSSAKPAEEEPAAVSEPMKEEPATGQPVSDGSGKRPERALSPSQKTKAVAGLAGFVLTVAVLSGLAGGALSGYYFYSKIKQEFSLVSGPGQTTIIQQGNGTTTTIFQDSREAKVISTVQENSPSVVSITVSKNMPVYGYSDPYQGFYGDPFGLYFETPQIKGYEMQKIGEGSGFIVSEDGLVLTNKHVASDKGAEYTVIMSDRKEYAAKVLAADPVQDIAILKIEGSGFRPVKFGSSSDLQIGQTVIAIGNALGEFPNTVSTGVISGLSRTITASDGQSQNAETLDNVIQTDAAINSGNSGGPLLNISGEVIGINTAMSSQGQGIGFALPIDLAKRDIEQVKKDGKISYPFLGIQYTLVDAEAVKENGLSVDYGALIIKGSKNSSAIIAGSPASKAGLKEGDVILEFNGEKISEENSLSKIISKFLPGDKVNLKILRSGKEMPISVTLGEYGQN
jgi:S1-C subfamily serine protease